MRCIHWFLGVTTVSVSLIVMLTACQEQVISKDIQAKTIKKLGTVKDKTGPEESVGSAKLTFEKKIHDFGDIKPSSRQSCEFKFTNTGSGILKIGKIKSTCGCSVPKLKQKEYAPHESGCITVQYSAGSKTGNVSKSLYVPSNDASAPKITLKIKAKITQKINVEPKRINFLLNKDNAGCPDIKLQSIDKKPFSIISFTSTHNCVTADFDPNAKDVSFELTPKVNFAQLEKIRSGRINIKLSHPQCRSVEISFSTLTELKADPQSLAVLKAQALKPVNREVWILNNYNQDFNIENVTSKKGYVKLLNKEKFGNRYKLELEIIPPLQSKKKRFFMDIITIKTSKGGEIEIPCRGFYAQ